MSNQDELLDKKIYEFLSRKTVWTAHARVMGRRTMQRATFGGSNDIGLDYEIIRWKRGDKPQSIWKNF